MSILDKIARATKNAGRATNRGLSSKTAMRIGVSGAIIAGLSNTIGKSTIDNAMEIAFDNPEADRAILGTDLSPSLLLGESGFGPISGAARNLNAMKYGVDTGSGVNAGTATTGAILGSGFGALAGVGLGMKKGKGTRSKVALGIGGAITGGIAGFAGGPALGFAGSMANAAAYARSNQQMLRESPFSNSSLATAQSLNASGDIVLGMHNSRRG
jgi:hypothetical protein